MKRFLTAGLISLLALPGVFASDESDDQRFTDVDPTHYYYSAIEWLADEEIVVGYEDGSFGATENVERVEALKMIMDYANLPELDPDDHPEFTDTDSSAWYMDHVIQGWAHGLVNGDPEGTFRPHDQVNRAEAMKIFNLAFVEMDLNYPGVEDLPWYEPYMDYAADNALYIPDEYGDYLPAEPLTRGELAEMIYRFAHGGFTGEIEYGVASYYGWSFDGANTASGVPLDAYGPMAAHKTLPFGTWVRVTNLNNNRFVDVEIVDRGPYITGRIIDLTPGAFEEIGWLSSGILNVRMEILETE